MTERSDASFDLAAEGLWRRLRDIVMVQAQWDRFVFDPAEERQRPHFHPRLEEAVAASTELVLRALRVAVDPVNYMILARLGDAKTVPLSSLMELTSLRGIPLAERISDLVQVGLAARAVDTGDVHATALTEGLLGIVEEIRGRLIRIVSERWRETLS